jgi:type IV secretion system protein VirB4
MKKWAGGDRYGRVFNGERDALTLDGSRLVAFDMTEMRGDPQLSAALTYYFMHRIRSLVIETPTPHVVFIDEAPDMLKDPVFAGQVEILLREHRKLQGSVILASQDAGAFTKSPIAETLINNTAGVFLLPNERAREEDYAPFRLEPDEWAFIKERSPISARLKRAVLVKRGGESVILDVSLDALGPYLRVFASGTPDRALIESLKQQFGPMRWKREYLGS